VADSLETKLLRSFVELSGAVLQDFDIAEYLHLLTQRASELLDVAEAGLMLATGTTLQVMASSSERARHLELFQLHNEDGPCLDCFRGGTAVIVEDLAAERQQWPLFVPAALDAGFASVHALPLRRSDERIGVLGLLGNNPGRLGESDLMAGQTMADLATIAILQQRDMQRALTTTEQLQTALASRIVIEQAKGILSERCGIGVDDSFQQLRSYARTHNRRLHDVAQELLQGVIPTEAFTAPGRGGRGESKGP
jgi:transcriptional regulator with GAF, ATPase, and Fis domain